MSREAEQIRDRRRAFALPGGSLDRAIRILAVGLPALVGAIAAAMLIAPLSPRGEVSFILDRNEAAVAENRLVVDDAMYRGEDNSGRPFSLTAGEAVQRSAPGRAEPSKQRASRGPRAATWRRKSSSHDGCGLVSAS